MRGAFHLRAKAAGVLLAVFSSFAFSQQIVERSIATVPHQPPSWFVRMVPPQSVFSPIPDDFVTPEPKRTVYGKPHGYQPQKVICGASLQEGVILWRYCVI